MWLCRWRILRSKCPTQRTRTHLSWTPSKSRLSSTLSKMSTSSLLLTLLPERLSLQSTPSLCRGKTAQGGHRVLILCAQLFSFDLLSQSYLHVSGQSSEQPEVQRLPKHFWWHWIDHRWHTAQPNCLLLGDDDWNSEVHALRRLRCHQRFTVRDFRRGSLHQWCWGYLLILDSELWF